MAAPLTPERFAAALRQAMAQINGGRGAEARPGLEALIAARPEQPDPYALMALVLEQGGDTAGGEAMLRRAIAINPRQGQYRLELGKLLIRAGRPGEARAMLEDALNAAPPGLAPAVRAALGEAMQRDGDAASAVALLARAHTDGQGGHGLELAMARALEALDRFDEAQAAYERAVAARPDSAEAHAGLSQLVWRRTQDAAAACQALDRALAAGERRALVLQKAKILEYAEDAVGAFALLEGAARRLDDPVLAAAAAQVAIGLDPARALSLAEAAYARAPDLAAVQATAAQARLAEGDGVGAAACAGAILKAAPHDQMGLALQNLARRVAGEAGTADYGLVRTYSLVPPAPWTSLDAYLAELAAALAARHTLAGHPIGQSTRDGSEASLDLRGAQHPAIAAFFEAVRAPIAAYIEAIGPGDDPTGARRSGRFALDGAWSVRLRPGGFHANHIHPRGWLSSAFYVALPPAVGDGEGREGWLKFGEPGPPTRPALAAEHFVRPEPGLLALFPSHFWHGTVPFGGNDPRLTIAFDVVPA